MVTASHFDAHAYYLHHGQHSGRVQSLGICNHTLLIVQTLVKYCCLLLAAFKWILIGFCILDGS